MARTNAERQREYRRRRREAKIAEEREALLKTFREQGDEPPPWLTPDWRPSAKYWALKGNLAKQLIAETGKQRESLIEQLLAESRRQPT